MLPRKSVLPDANLRSLGTRYSHILEVWHLKSCCLVLKITLCIFSVRLGVLHRAYVPFQARFGIVCRLEPIMFELQPKMLLGRV